MVVTFTTPGNVEVILSVYIYPNGSRTLTLNVNFHRDSKYAATMVAAGLAKHFDSAFRLLASAATEAAETFESLLKGVREN